AAGTDLLIGDAAGLFESSPVPFPPAPPGAMGIPVALGDGVRALHCREAPDRVWAAGSFQAVADNRLHILSTLAERHADGGWSMYSEEDTSSLEVNSDWLGVYSPGEGEAMAFGDRTFGGYTNTVEMMPIQASPLLLIDVASAMWGSSL